MVSLSTGDHIANFQLPDQTGTLWRLSEELQSGPIVIVLYRGDW